MRNKRILITGGAGFIGSHLAEALAAKGARITVIDNLSGGARKNLKLIKARFIKRDLKSPALAAFLSKERFDIIFHLAANSYVPTSVKDPLYDMENNIVATFNLLEAVRKGSKGTRVVLMSSAAVYGNPSALPIAESAALDPISPYGASKCALEHYGLVYSRVYGLKTLIARNFSTYGPRQKKQIVYDMIKKLYREPGKITVIGDGTQARDLVYVKDVVKALILLCKKGRFDGTPYNIATGRAVSTLYIVKSICGIMGLDPKFDFTGDVRPGDPHKWRASIARIRRLGFKPAYTIKEGLEETVRWSVQDEE